MGIQLNYREVKNENIIGDRLIYFNAFYVFMYNSNYGR